MAWNPERYLSFADARARPAVDLLVRVGIERPARIYDLGCGPGTVTALLTARWPAAAVTGVDSSPDMLARAMAEGPAGVNWVEADLARWAPAEVADLLFSNAALHWLDDHDGLFRRLMGFLTPGGMLAVQMPRNHAAPSHTAIAETVAAGPWRARLEPLLRPAPVAPPARYYDRLRPLAASLDIWETEYLHVLEGDDPVVAWTRGTALRPFLEALDGDEAARAAFLDEYAARLRAAYPRAADGRTPFPFRRLFLIALAPG